MADDRLDAIKAWLTLRQSSDRASSVAEDEKVEWLVAQLEDARADADRLGEELVRSPLPPTAARFPERQRILAKHRAAVQRRGQ